jgi:RHS repeat-associated protein
MKPLEHRKDPYQRVTDLIIEHLERGTVPWRCPWQKSVGIPRNFHTGRPYNGINVLLLGLSHHASPWWLTYQQALQRGGHVRKGEHGSWVIKVGNCKTRQAETPASPESVDSPPSDSQGKGRRFLREYTVFNSTQIDGIEFPTLSNTQVRNQDERIEAAEKIVAEMPERPSIHEGARTTACYRLTKGHGLADGQTPFNFSPDPVNLATGNYISDHVDLRIAGRGMDFVFRRFYNSGAYNPQSTSPMDALGSLGYSWRHSYEVSVSARDDLGSRTVHWEDGHLDVYQLNGGAFSPAVSVYDTLVENADGSVTVTTKHQIRYNFDSSGRLTSIQDRNDNIVNITYDAPGAAGKVDYVTDTVGRVIDFQYNADGRLVALVDPIGRRVEFDFDANQDLVAVRDARAKQTSYTYDALHQMLTGTDPLSHVFVRNEYGTIDPYTRAVVDQWDVLNQHTHIDYNFTTHVTQLFDPLCVTDAMRLPEINEHDARLRLVKRTDPAGNFESFEYVDAGLSKHTDKRLQSTTFTYDVRGNRTDILDAENQHTNFTYTPLNDPEIITGPSGIKKRYTFDAKGNASTITFPYIDTLPVERYRTSLTYTAAGQPETITDALNHSTTLHYDGEGNMDKVTNADNKDTTRSFDGVGRELSVTDALSHTTSKTWTPNDKIATTSDALLNLSSLEYDDNDNLITFTNRRTNITRYYYNAKDKLTRTLRPDLTEVKMDYDVLDRKWKLTDARGKITEFRYTAAGYLDQTIDPLLKVTQYVNDQAGNVTQLTDPDGVVMKSVYDNVNRRTRTGAVLDATTTLETITEYQAGNLVKSVTDPDLKKTTFLYDEADRLWKTVDAMDGYSENAYNDVSKKLWFTDPRRNKTEFTYTTLDQLETEKDPLGNIWTTHYDAVGNPVETIDAMSRTIARTFTVRNELDHIIYPNGPPVIFTYDEEGNPRTMTDALGTTETVYDAMGRTQSYTDAFGKTLAFDYNENGARRHITYPGSKQITLDYDDAGRPWKLTDWLNRVIERTYTTAGRPLRVDFPNGIKSEFTHDAAGRFKSFAHRLGTATPFASTSLTLTKAGDIKQFNDTPPLDPRLPSSSITCTHGTANQITAINGSAVTHDLNGNLTTGNLNGTTSHSQTFDFEDRLLSLTTAGQTNSNRYDGRGHRLESTQGTSTTRFVVDPHASLSQIMAETDTSGNVTSYFLYFGGLAARALPDGTASYYHVNHQGSIVAMTDGDGSITDTYQYDPFGVPMGSTGSSTNHFRYLGSFGLWDNCDGTIFARARHFYPMLGRFLSRDPLRGTDACTQTINRYIYALNNPLALVDVTGLSARDMRTANSTSAFLPYTSSPFTDALYDELGEWGTGFAQGATWTIDTSNLPNRDLTGRSIGMASGLLVSVFGETAAAIEHGGMLIESKLATKAVQEFTKSSLELGQEMHKLYKTDLVDGITKFKEFVLDSGKRVDFIDFEQGVIHELKPNNPRQIKAGLQQLQQYLQEVEKQFPGINWKTVLDTY